MWESIQVLLIDGLNTAQDFIDNNLVFSQTSIYYPEILCLLLLILILAISFKKRKETYMQKYFLMCSFIVCLLLLWFTSEIFETTWHNVLLIIISFFSMIFSYNLPSYKFKIIAWILRWSLCSLLVLDNIISLSSGLLLALLLILVGTLFSFIRSQAAHNIIFHIKRILFSKSEKENAEKWQFKFM